MEAPKEKLTFTITVLVIGAVITMVFGWIGNALEPVVVSADTWGNILGGLKWLAGEFSKFTSSLWFLLPVAALFGAWGGINADRLLQRRRRAKEPSFITVPMPPPKPPTPDPAIEKANRRKMLSEFDEMLRVMRAIINEPYKADQTKEKELGYKDAEIEAFYLTMKKAGFELPELRERDLTEYKMLLSVLLDIKPFLDAQHYDEAKTRGNEQAASITNVIAARHERLKEGRASKA